MEKHTTGLLFGVTGCVQYNTSQLFSSPISVPSREISWEEHLRNDLFCVSVKCKTLTQSIYHCFVVLSREV